MKPLLFLMCKEHLTMYEMNHIVEEELSPNESEFVYNMKDTLYCPELSDRSTICVY